jgi:hypothetical protein|tara:strand:- start:594505 stop:594624 length:120 start_codon:yes stop_codon:yes gene_type:complete
MGNIFYAVLAVILTSAFIGNVEQFIPNNVGYYVDMMLPF